jgi:hypothetical protein
VKLQFNCPKTTELSARRISPSGADITLRIEGLDGLMQDLRTGPDLTEQAA